KKVKLFDLKVGYSCNNKCTHCVITEQRDALIEHAKKYDLSLDECKSLIKNYISHGIKGIVITGGEPTIRSDLDKILAFCEENKLDITLQTNGRKLMRNRLRNIYPHLTNFKALVALHGAKAKTHDEITLVKNSFHQTCAQLSEFFALGFHATVKVVMNRNNINELADIVHLVHMLGGSSINFAYPHGLGDAKKNFNEIAPSYSELKPHLAKLIEVAEKLNIEIEFEAIPFCILKHNLTLVGELKYAQQEIVCSPVNQKSFDWDEVRLGIKMKGKQCANCDFDMLC
ncbi:radical SAM protein, partial [Photobacterium damselae]|nr:radical SAM protein [Photobacterium damselae]